MELEKRIKSVKERLGLQVPSDDDEELIKIKKELLASKKEPKQLATNSNLDQSSEQNSADHARIVFNSESDPIRQERASIVLHPEPEHNPKQRNEHARIVFCPESDQGKRKPVSERLGKKTVEESSTSGSNRTKISLNDIRREEDEILGRKEMSKGNRLVGQPFFCFMFFYM